MDCLLVLGACHGRRGSHAWVGTLILRGPSQSTILKAKGNQINGNLCQCLVQALLSESGLEITQPPYEHHAAGLTGANHSHAWVGTSIAWWVAFRVPSMVL